MLCETCNGPITLDWRKNPKKGGVLKFCSKSCSCKFGSLTFHPRRDRADQVFDSWKLGTDSSVFGMQSGASLGELPFSLKRRIKAFLLDEQKHECSICHHNDSWNGLPVVFILDHIDGNPFNQVRSNLRLICPMCESQQPTHGNRNRGKGRHSARIHKLNQRNEVLNK